jgi:DNA-binding CsgD family transcriptional regulator
MRLKNIVRKNGNDEFFLYRINKFELLFGIAVFIISFLTQLIRGHSISSIISSFGLQLNGIIIILLAIVSFFKSMVVKLTHVAILLFLTAFTLSKQYNNPYGLFFWILIFVLMYRYGFFYKRTILKIVLLFLFLICCIEISAAETGHSTVSISIALFLFMFLMVTYIYFKEELHKILFYEKRAKKLITETKQEKEQLQAQIVQQKAHIYNKEQKLKLMEEQLEKIIAREKPCDLSPFGLTSREKEIVELLITTKESNKEIAKTMGVQADTVKRHLHNIYDKIGVDDRHGLIELCRNNYSL